MEPTPSNLIHSVNAPTSRSHVFRANLQVHLMFLIKSSIKLPFVVDIQVITDVFIERLG